MQQHHSRLTGVHSIPKHCSFACLACCRLQGFFYFSPCQLCFYQVIFSFISSQVLISTSFFRPTRFSWSFVPKPTSISLLTRCYIIPDSWTSQMSTFVEFNVVLVHFGPHKKKRAMYDYEGLQALASTQNIVGTQWSNRLRIVQHITFG